jgi:hypothetical protein
MIEESLVRVAVIVVGLALGYAGGRYLWARRGVAVAPFPIIAAVAIVGLVSSRLFSAAGLMETWQSFFFPLAVSLGAGFSVTGARPPLQSSWWQIWRG